MKLNRHSLRALMQETLLSEGPKPPTNVAFYDRVIVLDTDGNMFYNNNKDAINKAMNSGGIRERLTSGWNSINKDDTFFTSGEQSEDEKKRQDSNKTVYKNILRKLRDTDGVEDYYEIIDTDPENESELIKVLKEKKWSLGSTVLKARLGSSGKFGQWFFREGDSKKYVINDALIKDDSGSEKKPGAGKKRSGGFGMSDLRKLLNQMHEKKNSSIKIKESGGWNSKVENSYQEAVGLYASEHKGKKWKDVSKKVGQKATLSGMYKWLSKLYGASAIQFSGKTIVQGGESNVEKISSILSGNAQNKNDDNTLKKQAQKFIDAGAKGDAKKIKTYIDAFVLGDGSGLNDNPRMQKSIIKGLLKIYAPGVEPAEFLKGTKAEKLYKLEESLGLSRGSLYRRRYRRY